MPTENALQARQGAHWNDGQDYTRRRAGATRSGVSLSRVGRTLTPQGATMRVP